MALREVRTMGDPILEKRSREVTHVTERMKELIDDMFETLYEQNGVGLSAVQVGVLKRIITIDISEEGNEPVGNVTESRRAMRDAFRCPARQGK